MATQLLGCRRLEGSGCGAASGPAAACGDAGQEAGGLLTKAYPGCLGVQAPRDTPWACIGELAEVATLFMGCGDVAVDLGIDLLRATVQAWEA